MTDMLGKATRIADEVFFPAAGEVDERGEIPPGHFDLLADEGFYGLAAPPEHGGPGLEFGEIVAALEAFAGGCLATTFTWIQHHGVVNGLVASENAELRERHLADAVRGRLRGGVAFAGAIPHPPRLWAKRADGGYLIDGEAPFVSGWGLVDVLQISARDAATVDAEGRGGVIVSGLIDANAGESLTAEPLRLVAAQGTNTVRLHFTGYFLPDDRITTRVTHADFVATSTIGSRLNGCVALGLAGRAARLIADAGKPEVADRLRAEQDQVRARLDAGLADPAALPAARAAASELAFRATGALVTTVGSGAVLGGHTAERLVREATFTLVAASRPEVKAGLLGLLAP
ncbi:acyl-CoA dehydrogenase family protein [Amycolatopsis anabasis]|uniref:acyl-CoA dehydrogenase family protein n=1 Tax=Amycolatopsis anabasis TaxID=1840409 RepID=UPI00131CD8AC|nr:acyl-CoA dehydrogenase family protein [Amycolatopsis anabasis]